MFKTVTQPGVLDLPEPSSYSSVILFCMCECSLRCTTGGRAGGKGGRARAQCWGIEELVAKTGDLACDLSTVPNSFNASHRFIEMTLHFTRTWHAKCRVIRKHSHLGYCAQGRSKVRIGQQETRPHLTSHSFGDLELN